MDKKRTAALLVAALLHLAPIAEAQDLETGLAACATLADEKGRAQCEGVMRRTAPCWKLSGQERRQCQDAAAKSDVPRPRDSCAGARDPARCRELLAAREACAGEPDSVRAACIVGHQMPRVFDCSHRRAVERGECGIYNRVLEHCAAETAAGARECVARNYEKPMQQVREGLNPLSCVRPASALASACALREELVAKCRLLDPAVSAPCIARYAQNRLLDCDRLPQIARGRCAAHNAGFELCTGKLGPELTKCQWPYGRTEGITRNCDSAQDFEKGPRQEWSKCADLDRAYGRCAARRSPPGEFAGCVESELPLSFKAYRWLDQHAPVVR